MRSTDGQYLNRVDHLRGWAAVMVLFFHGVDTLSGGQSKTLTPNPLTVWLVEGHTGVSMFIVLSGFILTIINRDVLAGAALAYRGFIWNRFLRIFPLLLLMTAMSIATRIPAFRSIDLLPLLTLQLYAADTIGMGNEWAVGTEFQCYFIFPVLLLAVKSDGLKYLAMFIVLMVLVRFTLLAGGYVSHDGSFYHVLLGRIDQFAVGMGAALIYLRIRDGGVPWFASLLAIGVGLAGLYFLLSYGRTVDPGVGTVGLSARYGRGWVYASTFHLTEAMLWTSVILGYLLLPLKQIPLDRVWSFIGEISFSLYLLHGVVMQAVRDNLYYLVLPSLKAFMGPVASACIGTLILTLPLTMIVAWLSYTTIERPAFAFRKPYLDRSKMVQKG